MNMSLIKLISILSGVFGLLCGFITLLPYIGGLAFFILMCFASIIIVSFLLHSGVLVLESVPESLTIGGIIGFISYFSFSIVYIPMIILLVKVFNYTTNYGVAIFAGQANLFVILTLSVFIGIVSATINACGAFGVYYVSELLKNVNKK